MKAIFFILFFLFVICSFSCNKDVTSITGKITDSWTSSPLAGVTVTSNPASTSITSDASGNYTITDITAGDYTLYTLKDRYVPDTMYSSVSKSKTATADISLNSVIGGTWTISFPEGYTFRFNPDGSYTGNNGNGSWAIASATSGTVGWTFNYGGSQVTYYGKITSRTTMIGINVTWTATRQ